MLESWHRVRSGYRSAGNIRHCPRGSADREIRARFRLPTCLRILEHPFESISCIFYMQKSAIFHQRRQAPGRFRSKIPCQNFVARNDLLVLGGSLRSQTICDLVKDSGGFLYSPEWVLTARGSYGNLSVENMLAADGLPPCIGPVMLERVVLTT